MVFVKKKRGNTLNAIAVQSYLQHLPTAMSCCGVKKKSSLPEKGLLLCFHVPRLCCFTTNIPEDILSPVFARQWCSLLWWWWSWRETPTGRRRLWTAAAQPPPARHVPSGCCPGCSWHGRRWDATWGQIRSLTVTHIQSGTIGSPKESLWLSLANRTQISHSHSES